MSRADALRAQAAAHRALADALDAEASAAEQPAGDELVPLDSLPLGGRDFWRARIAAGELPGFRGPRRRTLVRRSDAARVLGARPVVARPSTEDPLDAAIAVGAVRRRAAE